MAWTWAKPEYKPEQVNAAARQLSAQPFPLVADAALATINNWRSSHSYLLNTFQITLRNKARKIEREVVVAQRIKRLESIHAKLERQKNMRMTQMQDIAGCRAVFRKMKSVTELVELYKRSQFDHKLRGEKDYINHPKPDGYRCHHLVYEYVGTEETKAYNGLKVEIQIRTQLQHAWATAVEAVGIFTKQALKSNQGDQDWLRFFALMSTVVASIERCPATPGTPAVKANLMREISSLASVLHVQDMLAVYNTTLSFVGAAKDAKYFLLQLDPDSRQVTATRFRASQSEQANAQYTKLESGLGEQSTMQVVLVSVDTVAALKRAYPNYFLDTNLFGDIVKRAIKGDFPDPLPEQTAAPTA